MKCKYCGKEFSENIISIHEKWCGKNKEEAESKKLKETIQNEGKFFSMNVDNLKNYAEENGIDIGKSTSLDGVYKKIIAAEEEKLKQIDTEVENKDEDDKVNPSEDDE